MACLNIWILFLQLHAVKLSCKYVLSSMTNVSTTLITMHPYFNDFMFQRFVCFICSLYSWKVTWVWVYCIHKNNIFFMITTSTVYPSWAIGKAEARRQSKAIVHTGHTNNVVSQSKLSPRVDTKFYQNFAISWKLAKILQNVVKFCPEFHTAKFV
jgi:hypothetical protein